MAKKKIKVDLIPAIRKLEVISKSLITNRVIGGYKSVFRGKGLEFSDYRPYSFDDDASLIDWKATARTNEVLIKQYIEERDINVFFLIDASDHMLFGSTDKLKVEYVVELAASLSHAILEAGDSVGMSLYTEEPIEKISPSRGSQQFYIISKILSDPNMYGGKFNIRNAVDFCLNFLKQDTIVIIISDFISLNEDWGTYLRLMSSKFDTIGLMVRDPRDFTMPENATQIVIQDPSSNRTLLIEPGLVKYAFEKLVKEQEEKIVNGFQRAGADFVKLRTDKSFVSPILNLFRRRALKLR